MGVPGSNPVLMENQEVNVFNLRDALIGEYRTFSRGFVRIEASDIRNEVDRQYVQSRYWPESLIQISVPRGRDQVADLHE